ncbi:hypothetical protein LCM23_18600 [Cytobacillus kochii]|uniref:hypothetical protein n=1 Tax=Cytobacillus kochii TaxID=859143 RepID=UPI001CD600D3|nr:hypothetical protein [Cytobacillus kochii]MCA1028073.1 hypothetical protein [Cytobacillus kochii]
MRTSYEKEKKKCAQMRDTRKSGIEEGEEMRERAKYAHKIREREEELRAKARYAQKRYRGSREITHKSQIGLQV